MNGSSDKSQVEGQVPFNLLVTPKESSKYTLWNSREVALERKPGRDNLVAGPYFQDSVLAKSAIRWSRRQRSNFHHAPFQ